MRHQPVKGTIIVWMRTQKEGITIWTWLVLRTTLPDLKVSFCVKNKILVEMCHHYEVKSKSTMLSLICL